MNTRADGSAGRRLAVVVQRYGAGIAGGSESLARAVAERLVGEYQVTVLTTCARDYVTWRNEFAPGRTREAGVDVVRFAVPEERELESFNRLSDRLVGRAVSDEEEALWLRRQGPYVPELVEYLRQEATRFDAVLFFTYLYYPTVAGLGSAPRRSILVPTAHDEPALAMRMYRQVFARPRGFIFCTPAEEALVRSRFELGPRPTAVAGMGVESVPAPRVEAFKIRYDVRRPYVLYAGRIDAGKGCAEMINFFSRYRRDCRGAAELLLLGKLAMPAPRAPGVRHLGFLDEHEKAAALAGARAVICSSPYESLSIVLLESLALGTPVLANARSPVLLEHCRRSRAGLYYEGVHDFVEALDLLCQQPALRRALSVNGRHYVEQHYTWERVLARYREVIEAVASSSGE